MYTEPEHGTSTGNLGLGKAKSLGSVKQSVQVPAQEGKKMLLEASLLGG